MTDLWRRAALATLVLVFTLGIAIYASTERRLTRRFEIPETEIVVSRDDRTRERGEHIVRALAQCTTCHGADLSGDVMSDDWWLGRLDAPNLTPGVGGISAISDATLARSIRHGVTADGLPALLMPSDTLQDLTDRDVGSIIAYLRSVPAVDRTARRRWVGPMTRVVIFLDALPEFVPAELIDHTSVGTEIVSGPTAEYGAYLVQIGACRVCHGPKLEGGLNPLAIKGEPPPPSLAPGGALAGWRQEDFIVAMRTGRTPDGRQLDEAFMPWPITAKMKDSELVAIWRYLESLPAAHLAATHDSATR